ncbi:MAG: hypothetical protein JWL84_4645 [Rhodospirillales bacterium]|nr:hypothetical protein [Rhodospirillales bacterium]
MARLAAFLDQQTPFEHDVLGDGQDAFLEHRSHFVSEPVAELGAAACVGDELDVEADLGEGHAADEELVELLPGGEGKHSGFGLDGLERQAMRCHAHEVFPIPLVLLW